MNTETISLDDAPFGSNEPLGGDVATPKKKNLVSEVWSLLWFNARAFIMFECIYKLFGVFVLIPLLMAGANGCVIASGLEYVAPHNLVTFLASPIAIVYMLLLLVVVALYAFVDACACVLICQMSREGAKASALAIMKAALLRAAGVLKVRNLAFIPIMLVVLPMTNFIMAPSFLGEIEVPDFIVTYITYNKALIVIALVAFAALIIYAVRLMFVFHFYALRGQSFREAQRNSFKLGKGHVIRDVISCLVVEALYAVATTIIALLLFLVVVLFGTLFQGAGAFGRTATVMFSAVALTVALVAALIIATCSTPLCYAAVSVLYYRHQPTPGDESTVDLAPLTVKETKARRIARVGVIAAFYLVSAGVSTVYFTGIDASGTEALSNVGVVAHRCGANYAPENTIAALNTAADMGAEWCEIDVQMCADGAIIVIHDTNLERTGGLDKNTWEATYDEVKVLDSGSKFSAEFAGEPIPLLEDMIRAAQDRGMKLQIEIKPTGYDEGIEERVVEIIRAMGFQDQCYVASMDFACLQKVRACGDDIRTLYIMAMAYGNIAAITEADAYSVESMWITDYLVENVHSKRGAEICAWTVNSETFMDRCISAGADQLVTDEVELAEEVVADTRDTETLIFDILGAFQKTER